jgi:hypothetical protein
MRKIKIFLYPVLLFICEATFAQTNIVLTGFDKEVCGDIKKQSALDAIVAVKEPTCKMPTLLITVEKGTQSWQYFGQSFIANALFNVRPYNELSYKVDPAVCVGYVLTFSSMNERFYVSSIARKTIKTILKDKSYHERIYQWLKPALILAWKALGGDLQIFYKNLIVYVKTFNYAAEKKYYESLKVKGWEKELDFTIYEPNGKEEDRRKAKAWIFRRIYFDGWDFAYVLKWTKRFEKEIML